MQHMKCIVPATCGDAVVIEDAIECVTRGLARSSRGWRHDVRWNFELRCKLYGFADLHYATGGCIVQEALEMEDKYGWKRLDEHLLACLA